jgi:dihydroorotate dehydrogenase
MQILQNTYQTRFHGDNTGSNTVGDANQINKLLESAERQGLFSLTEYNFQSVRDPGTTSRNEP